MDPVKTQTVAEKNKKLAKKLGTGGAAKAASALMSREERMEAEMDAAMGVVKEKKTASRAAY